MITVVTDGACRQGESRHDSLLPSGTGGWAAIVDRDGRREVVHGRKTGTTNGEMELTAVVEGLRSAGPAVACVYTDYDEVGYVHWLWRNGELPDAEWLIKKRRDLWVTLAAEFDRCGPLIVVVGKRSPVEQREMIRLAHHAARSAMRGDDPAAPNPSRRLTRALIRQRTHAPGCHPLRGCVDVCPVRLPVR